MRRKYLSIDGTYPFDHYGVWRCMERRLPLDRVAELLGLELTAEELQSSELYLWLNKGFIVLGRGPARSASDGEALNIAMMEMLGSAPERKGIQVGDQAVYLHDGHYSLIERVAP